MKILHLLPSLNLYGGTPSKIFNLIKYSKHQHYIYCRDKWEGKKLYKQFKKEFLNFNIRLYEGFYNKNILKHIIHLLKIIKKEKIQIIQAYFDFDTILLGIIKFINPSIKAIVSFVNPFNSSKFYNIILSNLIYPQIDFFVYNSKYTKKIKQDFFLILKKKKGKIIYNGVEKKTNNLKKKNKNNELINVSGLLTWKNLFLLIDVMNILINSYNLDVTLTLIGDGPLKKKIKDRIYKYKLKRKINILGYKKNVGFFLDKSQIYVHPSVNESFGIAVVEAMLMKKPVILSNAGALPELIENNKSGILADPYDPNDWVKKIILLLENSKLRKKIALAGYKRAIKLFNMKNYVYKYDVLYEQI